jgi:hypothetical protein
MSAPYHGKLLASSAASDLLDKVVLNLSDRARVITRFKERQGIYALEKPLKLTA